VTDDTLLKRAANGDEAAFLLLYEQHRDGVLRFAYRFLGSLSAAEDVTHDVFLRIVRDPGRFDPARASFRTYLCAVARHLALTRRRQRKAVSLDAIEADGDRMASPGPGPLHQLLSDEITRAVRRACLELPASQRQVVILFEYEDLSLAEIAAVVGTGVGAVKARLHRARQQLRQRLAPYLSRQTQPVPGRKSQHET
jgi:RNA polymerase sigma-70 factor (ECF subfamily)